MDWEMEASLATECCARVWLLQTGWVPGPTPRSSLPASVSFLLHFTHCLAALYHPTSCTWEPQRETSASYSAQHAGLLLHWGVMLVATACIQPFCPPALQLRKGLKTENKTKLSENLLFVLFPRRQSGIAGSWAAAVPLEHWRERLFLSEGSGFYHVLLILQVC